MLLLILLFLIKTKADFKYLPDQAKHSVSTVK